jgi:hypothetical protein
MVLNTLKEVLERITNIKITDLGQRNGPYPEVRENVSHLSVIAHLPLSRTNSFLRGIRHIHLTLL